MIKTNNIFWKFKVFSLILFLFGQQMMGQRESKVLIIGIDGCRPDALQSAETPNIDKLISNGAYSYSAQTDEISSSGICWTGMLTGVWHEKHKVISNSYKNPNIKMYPHFFRRVKQWNPQLKLYSNIHWGPLHTILQKGDADKAEIFETDAAVTDATSKDLLENDVDVMFVHLDDVDHAGHTYGYGIEIPEYLKSISVIDSQVGRIIDALENRDNYDKEDWLILLSTDHGGNDKGHGQNIPEHTTIFYIASGNNTVKGKLQEKVHVIDVAVTAMAHLGVPIDDRWKLDGKVVGIKE